MWTIVLSGGLKHSRKHLCYFLNKLAGPLPAFKKSWGRQKKACLAWVYDIGKYQWWSFVPVLEILCLPSWKWRFLPQSVDSLIPSGWCYFLEPWMHSSSGGNTRCDSGLVPWGKSLPSTESCHPPGWAERHREPSFPVVQVILVSLGQIFNDPFPQRKSEISLRLL